MKKFIGMALAAVISASSFTALAAGAIPDHQGTSMGTYGIVRSA